MYLLAAVAISARSARYHAPGGSVLQEKGKFPDTLGLQTILCVIAMHGGQVGVRFCVGKVVSKCGLTEQVTFRIIAKCGVLTWPHIESTQTVVFKINEISVRFRLDYFLGLLLVL